MMKKLLIFVILFAVFGAAQAQKESAVTELEPVESSSKLLGLTESSKNTAALTKLKSAGLSSNITELELADSNVTELAESSKGIAAVTTLEPVKSSKAITELAKSSTLIFGKPSELVESSKEVTAKPSELLPLGSYQDTCTDIKFDGSMLTARCLNKTGELIKSSIRSAFDCNGFIENINGVLKCNEVEPGLPICQSVGFARDTLDSSTLYASCKNKDGNYVDSSLSGISQEDHVYFISDTLNGDRKKFIVNDDGQVIRVTSLSKAPPLSKALTKRS